MNNGKYVFSQILFFLPKRKFDQLVNKYGGNYKVRKFTCWDQLLCLLYSQLAGKDSLRDLEICLRSLGKGIYHFGIKGSISRSTIAEANEQRDYRIYEELAYVLIEEANKLYTTKDLEMNLPELVRALDSTTIDLCLSLFPWAHFRKTKSGIKVHTEFDLNAGIPVFALITSAKVSDVKFMDEIDYIVNAIYVVDRGYFDLKKLRRIHESMAYFIIRKKRKLSLEL